MSDMDDTAVANSSDNAVEVLKSPFPSLDLDDNVKIKVGEKTFETTKSTLRSECAFFDALFGDNIHCPDNGTYELDRDTDAFEEVLRYCRTKLCPLFRSGTGEFDIGRYAVLQSEASFYGCDKLAAWIAKKTYVNVVRRDKHLWLHRIGAVVDLVHSEALGRVFKGVGRPGSFMFHSGEDFEPHSVVQIPRSLFICPRGVPVHTSPEHCGRQCEKAKDPHSDYFLKFTDIWAIYLTKNHEIDMNMLRP